MKKQNKKRPTSAIRESQKKCVFCGKKAELKLDNGKYICENCAQIQNELGNEEELD